MNIIRRPGGAWKRATGRRLWYNRNGNRRLTTYGEERLINFQDLTIQIPVVESGLPTPEHPITRTRETWYPVSENSMPGLLAELQRTVPPALRDRLEDLTTLPQEFRNWVLRGGETRHYYWNLNSKVLKIDQTLFPIRCEAAVSVSIEPKPPPRALLPSAARPTNDIHSFSNGCKIFAQPLGESLPQMRARLAWQCFGGVSWCFLQAPPLPNSVPQVAQ